MTTHQKSKTAAVVGVNRLATVFDAQQTWKKDIFKLKSLTVFIEQNLPQAAHPLGTCFRKITVGRKRKKQHWARMEPTTYL